MDPQHRSEDFGFCDETMCDRRRETRDMSMPLGDVISQAGIMQHRLLDKIVQGEQSLRSCGRNQVGGHESTLCPVETGSSGETKRQKSKGRKFVKCMCYFYERREKAGLYFQRNSLVTLRWGNWMIRANMRSSLKKSLGFVLFCVAGFCVGYAMGLPSFNPL